MSERNDHQLRELYRDAQRATKPSAPDFEKMWQKASAEGKMTPSLSRHWKFAIAPALVAVLLVFFGGYFTERASDPSITGFEYTEQMAEDLFDEWEESALALNEWQAPTDFLLGNEDWFFD